jgi:hypothetical protein
MRAGVPRSNWACCRAGPFEGYGDAMCAPSSFTERLIRAPASAGLIGGAALSGRAAARECRSAAPLRARPACRRAGEARQEHRSEGEKHCRAGPDMESVTRVDFLQHSFVANSKSTTKSTTLNDYRAGRKVGGECEIRTHGRLPVGSFQDCWFKPLTQLSVVVFALRRRAGDFSRRAESGPSRASPGRRCPGPTRGALRVRRAAWR